MRAGCGERFPPGPGKNIQINKPDLGFTKLLRQVRNAEGVVSQWKRRPWNGPCKRILLSGT